MTWIVAVIVVGSILSYLFLGSSSNSSQSPKLPSTGTPIEDSRRLLHGLVQENRKRWAALPDDTVNELVSAARRESEALWDHGYGSAISDGKDSKFATHVGLLSIASMLITGEQKAPRVFSSGLDLETVPFKALPPEQAKSAQVEYCIAKYLPEKTDWKILNDALLKFADETFEAAKTHSDPDGYIYEMIYCETLDWQKFLLKALGERNGS